MANLRISQLPAATTIASADILPFSSISGTETRKITAQNLGRVLTQLGLTVGSVAPTTPYNGQIWVDTATNPPIVKVWNGVTFTIVSFQPGASIITNPGGTAPTSPILGQLWQDTSLTPDQLKMWDGSNWVRVDPNGITQAAGDARYLQIATAASTYLALAGGTLTGDLTLVGAPTTNNMAATKKYVDDQIAAVPSGDATPAGTVIWTARSTAPTGYLKANGAAVSRSTYATLFSAIGTFYGAGDGSTTFNLPDLRGEFVRGWDDGRGVDSGRAFASSQAAAFASHSHGVSDPGHSHSGSTGGAGGHSHTITSEFLGSGAGSGTLNRIGTDTSSGNINISTSSVGDHAHTLSINGAGTGISIQNNGGSETRPRNLALLACIKV